MSRQRGYGRLGIAVVTVLSLGWVAFIAAVSTPAQYHEQKKDTTYAAYGTVLEKENGIRGPLITVGKDTWHAAYLYVKFKTEEGVTFVIPFRTPDIEAIPVPREEFNRDTPAVPAAKEYTVHVDASAYCSGSSWVNSDGSVNSTPDNCKGQNYTVPASPARQAEHIHIPAVFPHGILKYHQCDGPFYCFDSWEDK